MTDPEDTPLFTEVKCSRGGLQITGLADTDASDLGAFMPNMGPYMAEKYTKMIEGITNDLGRTADKLAFAQNILRALKNPDMLVDGAPLTLERLQVMENGDIRTLPPPQI